jgi:hypothetical protein
MNMHIERRIATRHPVLRFAQIQAIAVLLQETVTGSARPKLSGWCRDGFCMRRDS